MKKILTAQVPVTMEVPDSVYGAVVEVLTGEYEPGYFGEGLTILDIGANVGSFSLWANLRWPGSTIYAYEPHPGTCAMLKRNLAGLDHRSSTSSMTRSNAFRWCTGC
jgi:predicted RNA methylase